jgi:hypothetical protein
LYRTGPAAVAIVLVLALASCGGGGSSSAGTTAESTAKATAESDVAARTPKSHGCQSQIGEFLGRMDDLRQSLLAGLSYSEYVVRVRAIRDAYEEVPVDRLGVGCLAGAASDAEDAFNQYLRAANVWGGCAATAGCAASEIEGRLQRRWRIASKRLSEAERT